MLLGAGTLGMLPMFTMKTFTLFLLCSLPLSAQTTLLPAAVDGAVQSSGILGLSVLDDVRNDTLRSGGNNIRQALYEFDLSTIAIERVVLEAYFEFETRAAANVGSMAVFRIDGYVGDGVITTSDFDVNEAAGGDLMASYNLVPADSDFTFLSLQLNDLTPLQSAIANGENYFGLRTETNNFATFQVSSLENTLGDPPPSLRLVLAPIPEPSTVGLLAFATVGLFRRRR